MKKKKNNILVTGGAGYIGVELVKELLKKGYSVRIVDTFLFGNNSLDQLKNKVEIIKKDIRAVNKNVLKDIDAVIHQAGFSNDPMAEFDPVENYQINTEGTLRFATLCKENNIKRFTFSSSASIYNRGILKRTRIQNENSKVIPKSPYSVSKYKAEQGLLKLVDKNFCPVIIRQGTVYGFSPRMRYDLVVNTMVKTAISENKIYVFCGGIQWRPLVDIHDVAAAHIKAIEAPENKVRGQIFNLLYDNYRVLELAHIVKNTFGKIKKINVKIIVDHSPRKDRSYRVSGDKILRTFKWKPEISLERSIEDMVNKIKEFNFTDYSNPRYYNIEWIKK